MVSTSNCGQLFAMKFWLNAEPLQSLVYTLTEKGIQYGSYHKTKKYTSVNIEGLTL